MDGQPILDVERPRSAFQLIGATVALYRRFPWLFLVLAAMVVVPYECIQLTTYLGLLHGPVRAIVEFLLFLADIALVLPLVSALHVHAVDDVREGRKPVLGPVARRGVKALPVLSPAAAISYICIVFGFLALIVPGVLLLIQWAVVAQVAALGAKSWRDALDRSKALTDGHGRHVLGLLGLVLVITWIPGLVLTLAFGPHETLILFLVRTAIAVAATSFGALAVGLLYFDLRARDESESQSSKVELTGDPLVSSDHDDEERPPGWYVDPDHPKRMRYWAADGEPGWSERTTKTPKATLEAWQRGERPAAPGAPERRSLSGREVEPIGHPLDPDSYSDEDRPPGWYVDPSSPWKMRYWTADGEPGWSKRTAKTPKQTLAGWRKVNDR